MSKDAATISLLGEILSDGYVIIDDHDLHGIWEYIPTSDEPDWTNESFAEYVRQSANAKTYHTWGQRLESAFGTSDLDFLRFKHKTTSGDKRKLSQYPAARFVRMMRELDDIVHKMDILQQYKAFVKRPSSWPEIFYKDGLVTQGDKHHRYTDSQYIELLDLLWKPRRIVSPSGKTIKNETPLTRDDIFQKTSIKTYGRLQDIMTGIRKGTKTKNGEITMRVYSPKPNSVFVEVCQK